MFLHFCKLEFRYRISGRMVRCRLTWPKLFTVGWVIILAAFIPACFGAYTNIVPIADTTLSENYPSNNFGAMKFVNSGTTQNLTKNRALFAFDIAGAIPQGSKIKAAGLTLEVTKLPADGYAF